MCYECQALTGPDLIPPKVVKIAGPILTYFSKSITDMINKSIDGGIFPNCLKWLRLYKYIRKLITLKKENYRSVIILPCLSKIFERVMADQLNIYFRDIFDEALSAFRTGYNCQYTLLTLTEKIKKSIRENHSAGAILMDLSKAFDCMPHTLLIAKFKAYGLQDLSIQLVTSYLEGRKQMVRVGNERSEWAYIIKGVPQGSILGPIFFNIFINDMFHSIKKAELINYTDDNTVTTVPPTQKLVVDLLQAESQVAIAWLPLNQMLANPEKFQAIFINCVENDIEIEIDVIKLSSEDHVKLLGVNLDSNSHSTYLF